MFTYAYVLKNAYTSIGAKGGFLCIEAAQETARLRIKEMNAHWGAAHVADIYKIAQGAHIGELAFKAHMFEDMGRIK